MDAENPNSYYYTYDNNDLYLNGNFTLETPKALQNYHWILAVGVIPVSLLGLLANAVSVWIWNANRKSNPMVLLFQYLGLADNFFLLMIVIRAILELIERLHPVAELYVFPLLYLSQSLSVYITMTMGVFRWLAVARPELWTLNRRHLLVTCGALAVWCLVLTALVVVEENIIDRKSSQHAAMIVVSQVVGLVLPTLLLLFFSVALLRITWQHKRLQSQKKHRKTTTAVLCIAVSSFLANPVAVTVHLLAVLSTHSSMGHLNTGCNFICVFAALGAGDLMQALNSSINFFFYFLFASKFRPLLLRKLCASCRDRRWRLRQRKASTASSMATESGSGGTSSTCNSSQGASRQNSVQTVPSMESTLAPIPAGALKSSAGEDDLPLATEATSLV